MTTLTRYIQDRRPSNRGGQSAQSVQDGGREQVWQEIMADNAWEVSMRDRAAFNGPVPPVSNGAAERMTGVLTIAVRAVLHDSGVPKSP